MILYILGKLVCAIIVFFFYPFNLVGANNIPKSGRAIIVSNHKSNWDPILIALITYRYIHYLGKKELFKIPLLSWFFKTVYVIPVDRENVKPRTLIDCLKLLKNDEVLGIFPEGTRVKERTNDILDGFVVFAIRSKSPIIPVHIDGKIRPWRRINIIVGEPILLEDEFDKKMKDVDTKKIANDILDEIYSLKME